MSDISNKVRVRFAPSPTGMLHIGGLRTALTNYLFARKHGGTLLLRIEDTDRARFVEGAEQDILESLKWAGITLDEGPGLGGDFEPYRQSERAGDYEKAATLLLESGHAYLAFDTAEEIEALRSRHRSDSNPNPRYDMFTRGQMKNSLTLKETEVQDRIQNGEPYVVRLKVVEGSSIVFDDMIRGRVEFSSDTVDDQILVKSDGLPTYHLANVVDDHEMEISHVIRGEEWLPSTPKHILLYRAFGWTAPKMAHLPLILSPSGGKLSKRGAERAGIPVSVADYRAKDYEPSAVINFLALLGWNPGDERELFSLEELVNAFSFARMGQSGVQFDLDKLKWFNEHYLRIQSAQTLLPRVRELVQSAGHDTSDSDLIQIIDLMKERISFLKDILEAKYLFSDPVAFDEKSVSKRWKENSSGLVHRFTEVLESVDNFSAESLDGLLRGLVESLEIGAGQLLFPVRLSLTGVPAGPDLFGLMEMLGKDTCIRRLRYAPSELEKRS